jgi:serine/threonine protein kinase
VIHRDLKPANIMLGPYGESLVVDWGLAKVMGKVADDSTATPIPPPSESQHLPTQHGHVLGTVPYMSPEQAAGLVQEVGPPSDIYSLGATLYCLLTGHHPIKEVDTNKALALAVRSEFPRPRQVKPSVPVALEAIVLKAMANKPEHRYPSAKALAEDIERWLADEPTLAHQETRMEKWARFAQASSLDTCRSDGFIACSAGLSNRGDLDSQGGRTANTGGHRKSRV